MPDHRGPTIVEHPLNHATRRVLVAAVRFEHGANALVRLKLCFRRVIFQIICRTVAGVERVGKDVNVFEFAAAGVKVPPVINRPSMFFRQHFLYALDWRHRRARTRFSIKSVAAAASTRIAVLRVICT